MIRLLRLLMPLRVYAAVRELVVSLITPVAYAAQHGYYRSAITQSVTGPRGRPTPWMTFPLVMMLEERSFTGRSVLEFGSGASSAWWGARAESVVALETDPAWLARSQAATPRNVHVVGVDLDHATQESFDAEIRARVGDRRFDVVVVDGGDRVKALNLAPSLLTHDGFIVVDDLDLFDDDPDWRSALHAWHSSGFARIDFFGLAAAAPFTRRRRCSSLFFRNGSFVTTVERL